MKFFSQKIVPILFFFVLAVLLTVTTSFFGLVSPVFLLNENQILYLFSTSAQVLGGVYGLTLTGFIFFRNELSREELDDATLTEAVESLNTRYFVLLAFITFLVLLTFALSNVAISGAQLVDSKKINIIINTAQSFYATSLCAIAYFIFDVTFPGRIASASRVLQEEVDPAHNTQVKGSLEEFLRNYNAIENILIDYGQIYLPENRHDDSKPIRRIANSRLAEILAKNGKMSKELYFRIKNLITLRNSIIHGADPVVSQDIVIESTLVAEELKAAMES
ncbi:MAG: hypothetical protein ACO1RX_11235 [Candidatus Sericytochromatia bacterium]